MLLTLPDEIIIDILKVCRPSDLCTLSRSCKKMTVMAELDVIWKPIAQEMYRPVIGDLVEVGNSDVNGGGGSSSGGGGGHNGVVGAATLSMSGSMLSSSLDDGGGGGFGNAGDGTMGDGSNSRIRDEDDEEDMEDEEEEEEEDVQMMDVDDDDDDDEDRIFDGARRRRSLVRRGSMRDHDRQGDRRRRRRDRDRSDMGDAFRSSGQGQAEEGPESSRGFGLRENGGVRDDAAARDITTDITTESSATLTDTTITEETPSRIRSIHDTSSSEVMTSTPVLTTSTSTLPISTMSINDVSSSSSSSTSSSNENVNENNININKRRKKLSPLPLPKSNFKAFLARLSLERCFRCGVDARDRATIGAVGDAALEKFKRRYCKACQKTELVTRGDAKLHYLLTDKQLAQLTSITKPWYNKTCHLYLRSHVESLSVTRWGSRKAMEAEKERRPQKRRSFDETEEVEAHSVNAAAVSAIGSSSTSTAAMDIVEGSATSEPLQTISEDSEIKAQMAGSGDSGVVVSSVPASSSSSTDVFSSAFSSASSRRHRPADLHVDTRGLSDYSFALSPDFGSAETTPTLAITPTTMSSSTNSLSVLNDATSPKQYSPRSVFVNSERTGAPMAYMIPDTPDLVPLVSSLGSVSSTVSTLVQGPGSSYSSSFKGKGGSCLSLSRPWVASPATTLEHPSQPSHSLSPPTSQFSTLNSNSWKPKKQSASLWTGVPSEQVEAQQYMPSSQCGSRLSSTSSAMSATSYASAGLGMSPSESASSWIWTTGDSNSANLTSAGGLSTIPMAMSIMERSIEMESDSASSIAHVYLSGTSLKQGKGRRVSFPDDAGSRQQIQFNGNRSDRRSLSQSVGPTDHSCDGDVDASMDSLLASASSACALPPLVPSGAGAEVGESKGREKVGRFGLGFGMGFGFGDEDGECLREAERKKEIVSMNFEKDCGDSLRMEVDCVAPVMVVSDRGYADGSVKSKSDELTRHESEATSATGTMAGQAGSLNRPVLGRIASCGNVWRGKMGAPAKDGDRQESLLFGWSAGVSMFGLRRDDESGHGETASVSSFIGGWDFAGKRKKYWPAFGWGGGSSHQAHHANGDHGLRGSSPPPSLFGSSGEVLVGSLFPHRRAVSAMATSGGGSGMASTFAPAVTAAVLNEGVRDVQMKETVASKDMTVIVEADHDDDEEDGWVQMRKRIGEGLKGGGRKSKAAAVDIDGDGEGVCIGLKERGKRAARRQDLCSDLLMRCDGSKQEEETSMALSLEVNKKEKRMVKESGDSDSCKGGDGLANGGIGRGGLWGRRGSREALASPGISGGEDWSFLNAGSDPEPGEESWRRSMKKGGKKFWAMFGKDMDHDGSNLESAGACCAAAAAAVAADNAAARAVDGYGRRQDGQCYAPSLKEAAAATSLVSVFSSSTTLTSETDGSKLSLPESTTVSQPCASCAISPTPGTGSLSVATPAIPVPLAAASSLSPPKSLLPKRRMSHDKNSCKCHGCLMLDSDEGSDFDDDDGFGHRVGESFI
ncbi:hypothetical protein HDU76_010563 [Blyttiomyces sp. JEL0837]|nr:hypothetical protein HDU76_010563 [Blyttiomyces sp. JEL0837]